jgi:hypothetical protein
MYDRKEPIDYKFKEDITLADLQEYVDSTYNQHYSQGKYQATDMIVDAGFGEGFLYWQYNEICYALRKERQQKKRAS